MTQLSLPLLKSWGIIDSHTHIWSNGSGKYRLVIEPPQDLVQKGSVEYLVQQMLSNGVQNAVIVQVLVFMIAFPRKDLIHNHFSYISQ